MIKTSINAACKRRGILTAYQLAKVTGLYPAGATRLFSDELSKIDLATLDRLVKVLSTQPVKKPKACKISELFVVVTDDE
jgi:DNA-binding Xre family transcriptional regulator